MDCWHFVVIELAGVSVGVSHARACHGTNMHAISVRPEAGSITRPVLINELSGKIANAIDLQEWESAFLVK